MAEGGALLRRYGGELLHRGFESLLLRQYDQPVIRRALVALLVLATVLVGALAPTATAAPPTLIRLVSITTAESSVDVKPKKASPGDHERFASRLLNERAQFGKKKGAVVGSDSGTLRLTKKMVAIFRAEARLPGGTIRAEGTLKSIGKGGYAIAVVGGTGQFEGVHGSLTILAPINSKTAVNIYRLTYPLTA